MTETESGQGVVNKSNDVIEFLARRDKGLGLSDW